MTLSNVKHGLFLLTACCLLFTTASFAQQAPLLTSPANGSVNLALSATLSWNSAAGATSYSWQVSTLSDFSQLIMNTYNSVALSVPLTGAHNLTTYYWHVAADSASSTVWSSTWSFTTAVNPSAPTAPTLASPANGATNQSISPTLSWNSSTNALSYDLQLSTSNSFTTPVLSLTGLKTLSVVPPALVYSTVYYWRVNATNDSGSSAWTGSRRFTTMANPVLPVTPTLSSPANNATGQPLAATLSWTSSASNLSYAVQLATSTAFASPIVDLSGIKGQSEVATGLGYGTVYYWHVNGSNDSGTSVWSGTRSFTTLTNPAFPATPTLASPSNAATGQPATLTLAWNSSVNALTYALQISTSNTFASTILSASKLADLSTVVSVGYGRSYYWRVMAVNDSGSSAWSTTRYFTTVALTAPTIVSPTAGATGLPQKVTLSWGSSEGATSYSVLISTNVSFSSTISNTTVVAASTFITDLNGGQIYFWRVQALGAGNPSAWSETSWFSITSVGVKSGNLANLTPSFSYKNGLMSYSIVHAAPVQISLYDLRGREIHSFNRLQQAGSYAFRLADRIPSGIYLVRFKSGAFERQLSINLISRP